MTIQVIQHWEPVKTKPSTKQRIQSLIDGSDIRVKPWGLGLRIDIVGDLANVPSLKNGKMPGRGINLDALIKLKALDELFKQEAGGPFVRFEDGKVFVLVSCAARSRVFDPVNVLETVQDWLEPASKVVGRSKPRARGWGIGVVDNDSQITGLAVHADLLPGFDRDITSIFVLPWAQAGNLVCELGQRCLNGRWQAADCLPPTSNRGANGPETVS